jgi:hypothetical protein
MRLLPILVFASLIGTPGFALTPVTNEKADFFLMLDKCKATIAAVHHQIPKGKEALMTVDGDPFQSKCTKKQRKVVCTLTFPSGDKSLKGDTHEYEIFTEMAGMFLFGNGNGSEYYYVDQTQNAVVSSTRIVSERMLGAKICQGTHLTRDEMQALALEQSKKQKAK